METKIEEWLQWMEVIKDEVQELVITKRTFHEVQQLIKDNPTLHQSNTFYNYLSRTYVSHVIIGLRRQIKGKGNNCISMVRLFNELIKSPQVLTRSYYVDLYKGSSVECFADKDFNKFAAPGSPHIDPTLVRADLNRLLDASKRCEDFADKRVAHRDKRELDELPNFNEVDACIALLDELYVRYFMLFHAKQMDSLLPTLQYDWKEIFRVPWIFQDKK
jgi:hypothetical protein